MAARRVFVVSGAGLAVWHRRGSKELAPFRFEAGDAGLARFERYLERFPGDVTRVVADVVEEEFREETIPHVLAWDRRALLRTRAARAFPGARRVHTTKIGREPGGRRDDRVLFSAITRPEALAPWLAPMARHGAPLAGIHSPAVLTGSMLKAIGAEGGHVLVVSLQSGGGLRQTCFRRGKLRLSRLAALPDPAAGGDGSGILAEVERTRRYLGSLGTGADEDRLEVYLLLHGEPLEALRRALRHGPRDEPRCGPEDEPWSDAVDERRGPGHKVRRDSVDGLRRGPGHEVWRDPGDDPRRAVGEESRCEPGDEPWRDIRDDLPHIGEALPRAPERESLVGLHLVDLAEVARKLGLHRWGGEPTADRLFVHLLARRPVSNHYATPDETRGFVMRRVRRSLGAAGAALLAGACLFGGIVALEGVTARGHARSLALHAALYESRYRAARATLPPAPAEPVELERVVSAARALHGRRADPIELLALLADALAGFPRVRIEGLAWRASGDAESPVGGQGAGGADALREHAAPVSANDDAAHGQDAGVAGPRPSGEARRRGLGVLFLVARVSARIEPFDGDYRAAIDTIRRFAGVLAASPGVEHVRILTLPLELGSGHTLSGAAGATADAAAFELRVALRVAVPVAAEA